MRWIGVSNMRLRTKIKLAAVSIAVISTTSMSVIGYISVREVTKFSLRERVETLATAVAAGVDPAVLESVGISKSADSRQYAQLEKLVRDVTVENQRGDFKIRFVYLLTPTQRAATSGWDFAVDSDPRSSPDWSPPGGAFDPIRTDTSGVRIDSSHPSSLYVKDTYGEWLSGFAPIKADDGRVVGLVGADIPYQEILSRNVFYFRVALGLSLLFAVVVFFSATIVINRLMRSVTLVREFIHAIGEGDFARRLELPAKGEVSAVCAELNAMARRLGDRDRLAQENISLAKSVTRQQAQLDSIRDIDVELNKVQDTAILMERILTESRRLLKSDAGSVWLREGDDLLLTYVQNDTLSKQLSAGRRLLPNSARIPVSGGSISGYAALSGEPVVLDDAYAIPVDRPYHFNDSVDRESGYRTHSVLAVPLRTSAGKNVGVLQLLNPLDDSGVARAGFSPDDLGAMHHFASAATLAIERAALTDSSIERIIRMTELHDPSETGAHVNRVAAYSVILYEGWAKRHGITGRAMEHDRNVLSIAAKLHDVGKAGIDESILKKAGRLTADEYSKMQQHTVIGARIFSGRDTALDRTTIEVALHHHERWDGAGYPGVVAMGEQLVAPAHGDESHLTSEVPSKMKGEAIPIFARIVSVADVFDALSSKRQYKEAWPEDRVLAEMKVNAGRQFDPELIEILLERMDEIRLAAARYLSAPIEEKKGPVA